MSPSEYPTVCVIIPTMQRRHFLAEMLSHLARTSYPHDRLEVFVADGGSTDGSEEVVRQFRETSGIHARWYSDKSLRVSAARNHALRNTEAECVVFVDDDCITHPAWIGSLVGPLARGEGDLAGGTDEAPEDDPFLARCEDVAFGSVIGSGGVRGAGGAAITGYCPNTANMAMRRGRILELGAFDESMKAVEDTEFAYRARAAGLSVVFVPEATIKHRRRASVRSICYHNYIRGYGRSYLWRRYPRQPQGAFFLPLAGLALGVMLLAAGFFARWAWVILLAGMGFYGALLAAAGIEGWRRVGRAGALVVVPFLVGLHHFWYAIGTLHGPLTGFRKLFVDYHVHLSDPFGRREKPGGRPGPISPA